MDSWESVPSNRSLPRRLWIYTRSGLLLDVALGTVPPRLAAFVNRFRRNQRDPFWRSDERSANAPCACRADSCIHSVRRDRGDRHIPWFDHRVSVPAISRARHYIEVNERFFAYSAWRLRKVDNVRLVHGNSIDVLRSIAEIAARSETTFFYLDAHWEQHLPLREEMNEVVRWDRWVALIDDFEVPDDPGYGFDDYGSGSRLTLDYLELGSLPTVATFWPSTPSAKEAGSCRGCVVISSETLAPVLDHLPCSVVARRGLEVEPQRYSGFVTRRRTSAGTRTISGTTCPMNIPITEAVTTPTAPYDSATAAPTPSPITAITTMQHACHRASFASLGAPPMEGGYPASPAVHRMPVRVTWTHEFRVPESTSATHGPSSVNRTAPIAATAVNTMVVDRHRRTVASGSSRRLTKIGQNAIPAVVSTDHPSP